MRHCDPVMATGWHMALGGAGLLALSLASDGPELGARLSGFGASDAAAMAYGSLLGGAAAYGIFFFNATRGSLTALSSLTFLTPMFAAVCGRGPSRGRAGRARGLAPRESRAAAPPPACAPPCFASPPRGRRQLRSCARDTPPPRRRRPRREPPAPTQGAGYFALGETLTPVQLTGAGITLAAVYLINTRAGK
jgi:hypothetical protein